MALKFATVLAALAAINLAAALPTKLRRPITSDSWETGLRETRRPWEARKVQTLESKWKNEGKLMRAMDSDEFSDMEDDDSDYMMMMKRRAQVGLKRHKGMTMEEPREPHYMMQDDGFEMERRNEGYEQKRGHPYEFKRRPYEYESARSDPRPPIEVVTPEGNVLHVNRGITPLTYGPGPRKDNYGQRLVHVVTPDDNYLKITRGHGAPRLVTVLTKDNNYLQATRGHGTPRLVSVLTKDNNYLQATRGNGVRLMPMGPMRKVDVLTKDGNFLTATRVGMPIGTRLVEVLTTDDNYLQASRGDDYRPTGYYDEPNIVAMDDYAYADDMPDRQEMLMYDMGDEAMMYDDVESEEQNDEIREPLDDEAEK